MITNPKLHSSLLIIWTFYTGLQQYVFFFHLSAIQTCVSLLRQGRPAPHREARQKRREMRLRQQAEQEELELRMRELQVANEAKQLELEKMRKVRRTHTNAMKDPHVNSVWSGNAWCVFVVSWIKNSSEWRWEGQKWAMMTKTIGIC